MVCGSAVPCEAWPPNASTRRRQRRQRLAEGKAERAEVQSILLNMLRVPAINRDTLLRMRSVLRVRPLETIGVATSAPIQCCGPSPAPPSSPVSARTCAWTSYGAHHCDLHAGSVQKLYGNVPLATSPTSTALRREAPEFVPDVPNIFAKHGNGERSSQATSSSIKVAAFALSRDELIKQNLVNTYCTRAEVIAIRRASKTHIRLLTPFLHTMCLRAPLLNALETCPFQLDTMFDRYGVFKQSSTAEEALVRVLDTVQWPSALFPESEAELLEVQEIAITFFALLHRGLHT